MKTRKLKFYAILCLLTFAFEICAPTVALALTSGPTQPDFQGFTPFGTQEMVDPFTGDFNYNLPLFTIPGPNGGYPINMSYTSGVGMEDEASWVGLGWTLNPGSINRTKRGIPDDFRSDGINDDQRDIIEREFNILDDVNAAVLLTTPDVEINAFSTVNFGLSCMYNRRTGLTMKRSLSHTMSANNFAQGKLTTQASFSPQNGLSLNPSISIMPINRSHLISSGANFSSKIGLYNATISYKNLINSFISNYAGEIAIPMNRFGLQQQLGLQLGMVYPALNAWEIPTSMTQSIVTTQSKTQYGAVGFCYEHTSSLRTESESGDNVHVAISPVGNDYLMDYTNRFNEAVSQESPVSPIPNHTYDIYRVNGHGVSNTFRAHRSDYSILYEPKTTVDIAGTEGEFEGSAGNSGVNTGLTAGLIHTHGYSGIWKKGFNNLRRYFSSLPQNIPSYEPFYFKAIGESVYDSEDLGSIRGDTKFAFDIANTMSTATAFDRTGNQQFERTTRQCRQNVLHPRTLGFIRSCEQYSSVLNTPHIFNENQFPYSDEADGEVWNVGSSVLFHDHHFAEMEVIAAGGMRYVYGLPAYNHEEISTSFRVEPQFVDDSFDYSPAQALIEYEEGDNTLANNKGDDHFYEKTILPKYVYMHHLTAIYSDDYVDLTGDGPTEDDLGGYVKFNYSKIHDEFNWRSPIEDMNAHYSRGNYTDPNDDIGSYTYGSREVYILNSIETKTHIAEFVLNDKTSEPREDALGVYDENGGVHVSSSSRFLSSINLFSKLSPQGTPAITNVNFDYDYSLCEGIPNRNPDVPNTKGTGKLTLKKVWINHDGNSKGELNPFVFKYNDSSNPNYDNQAIDRWGSYSPNNQIQNLYNSENAYVNQSEDFNHDGLINEWDVKERNDQVSSWHLTEVDLPSGGSVLVHYEPDDYGFVQNKKAMSMAQVIGFSENMNENSEPSPSLNANNMFVWFELERDHVVFDTDYENALLDVKEAILDVDDLYFKMFTKLKKSLNGQDIFDYVLGYCELDMALSNCNAIFHEGKYYGVVRLKGVSLKDKNGEPLDQNPIQKAAWQYLRLNRSDLFEGPEISNGNPLEYAGNFIQYVGESILDVLQFYKTAKILGYCSSITAENEEIIRPSFIRVNSQNGKKFGGSVRVSKIEINDNWNSMTDGTEDSFNYGQTYKYEMADGSSSGIASYEPTIGNDENPWKSPIRFSKKLMLAQDPQLYMEGPINESYFPSPSIGYRRVIIENIKRDEEFDDQNNLLTKKSQEGIRVLEFYTTKEFPVIVEMSERKHLQVLPKWLIVPFVGFGSWNSHSYSQGYSIQLNNMNGKIKSSSVYPAFSDVNAIEAIPTTSTKFNYKVKNGYSDEKSNQLDNVVKVVNQKGQILDDEFGVEREVFVNMSESSTWTENIGIAPDVDFVFPQPFLPVPGAVLSSEYSRTRTNFVTTNKVIIKHGILESKETFVKGSKIKSSSGYYDTETGTPLFSETSNEYDDPVYSSVEPGHRHYKGLNGAYRNIGELRLGLNSINANGIVEIDNLDNKYFMEGDVLALKLSNNFDLSMTESELEEISISIPYQIYYVVDANDEQIELRSKEGEVPTENWMYNATVVKSGFNNKQGLIVSETVSLSNPLLYEYWLLDYLNELLESNQLHVEGGVNVENIPWCSGGFVDGYIQTSFPDEEGNVSINISINDNVYGVGCHESIVINGLMSFSDFDDSYFQMDGEVLMFYHTENGELNEYICSWDPLVSCIGSCDMQVLNSSVQTLKQDWGNVDYTEVGNPLVYGNTSLSEASVLNPYAFGQKGIYKAFETYGILDDRKQSGEVEDAESGFAKTRIRRDGVYENFERYVWGGENQNWTKLSEISKYSPFGFAVEERNALNYPSSAHYGYGGSVPIAVCNNSTYQELGYCNYETFDSNGDGIVSSEEYTLSGNIYFDNASVSYENSHTGRGSLKIEGGESSNYFSIINEDNSHQFSPIVPIGSSKKYVLSFWKNVNSEINVEVSYNSQVISDQENLIRSQNIEEWEKVDLIYEIENMDGTGSQAFQVTLSNSGINDGYIDDLRIMPYDSDISTFVYDPSDLSVIATLNNQNYATLFNYDEEGILVQTKIETEIGIITTATSRKNSSKIVLENE